MRPFIKEVRSNVKSRTGDPYSVKLGKHTLILGNNRSGKTSIIQAVELAATARVDDLMGRSEVRLDNMLLSLAPEGEALTSVVEFTDGKKNGYHKDLDKKAVTSHDHDCTMMHRWTRKILSGSPAKLEEAIIEWLDLKGVSEEEVLDLLPSKVHAKYLDIADHMAKRCDNRGQLLVQMAEYAAKSQRELGVEIKALKQVQDAFAMQCGGIRQDDEITQSLVDMVNAATPSLTHLQKAAAWAADAELENCPTCGTHVGYEHMQASSAHLNNQTAQGSEDLSTLVQRVEELMHDRIMWAENLKYKRQIDTKESWREGHKDLKTACLAAVSYLVSKHMDEFCISVNKYLPESWSLRFSAAHRTLGLAFDDGKVHTSVSGAEWATLVTAISCAGADSMSGANPMLLVVEDRAWDAATLASVMRALNKFDGQIIIQSTVKPKGRMPKGWDIVETKSVFEGKKPEPKQITPLAMTMMKSLGYNEEELSTMSKKTLDELMEGGVVRGDVLLTENGGWERDTSES